MGLLLPEVTLCLNSFFIVNSGIVNDIPRLQTCSNFHLKEEADFPSLVLVSWCGRKWLCHLWLEYHDALECWGIRKSRRLLCLISYGAYAINFVIVDSGKLFSSWGTARLFGLFVIAPLTKFGHFTCSWELTDACSDVSQLAISHVVSTHNSLL